MTTTEYQLPAASVSPDGRPPAPGDTIEVQLTGKVTRIENGQVSFTPATANGLPIGEPAPAELPEEPTEENLRDAAARVDNEDDGY